MKILGICCSPRKGEATFKAMEVCLAAAREVDEKIDTELVELAGMTIGPCIACNICKEGLICGIDDDFGELIPVLADKAVAGVIIGTPVYFGSMTAQIKAYMDRIGFVNRVNEPFLGRKIGAAVVPGRRAGHLMTFAELNMWFLINGMIVPGSSYWNVAMAGAEGQAAEDHESIKTLDQLTANIQWLSSKLSD